MFLWMETPMQQKISEEIGDDFFSTQHAPEDVLIGTDVASKGLDFPAIQHVPGMCDVTMWDFIAERMGLDPISGSLKKLD